MYFLHAVILLLLEVYSTVSQFIIKFMQIVVNDRILRETHILGWGHLLGNCLIRRRNDFLSSYFSFRNALFFFSTYIDYGILRTVIGSRLTRSLTDGGLLAPIHTYNDGFSKS